MSYARFFLMILTFVLMQIPTTAISKQIRDWNVWCHEDLTCTLQTDNYDNGVYSFGFQRGPQANAPTVPVLSTDTSFGNAARITLTIDAVKFFLDPTEAETRNGTKYFVNQNSEHRLLKAMMAGNEAKLTFEQPHGLRSVAISLSGVTAGALYMDEAQQRLDQSDAIKAVGSGEPKDAISRVIRLASSGDLPLPVLAVWRANDEECSNDFGDGDLIERFGGQRIAGLNGNDASLYVLPCGGPGAYNLPATAIAYDQDQDIARKLYFPRMTSGGPSVMDTAINSNWEPVKNHLKAFAKGRGLGDCGLISEWDWGGNYYSEFILVEERRKDECDGEDNEWPKTWPLD